MKRLVVALGLTVLAAAAQAQTADDRFPKPSPENPSALTALRNWLASKTGTQKPAEVKAAEKAPPVRHIAVEPRSTAAEAHPRHRYQVHRYRVHDTGAPKIATIAPAAVASVAPAASVETPRRAAIATPSRSLGPPLGPPAEAMTTSAATTGSITPPAIPASAPVSLPENLNMPRHVTTITVMAPRPSAPRSRHGISHCTTGERIITAFYWEGKHTASGARFDPDGYTAAHRSYPFGTRLLVINPRNGKSVTVTVNDRGPFVHGVTLDITRGAAKAIGLQGNAAVCMAKM